ncbi:MAG: HAD family phosphatase [Candidatus Marsarchaeota archaeon]|nr:HAD family phosphatase [Candidatus Marsarchaeota archaeon]MCL5412847.1 HAD family phosphatase [Candidatus Marsarchaeota archaeon]
MIKVLIFDLGGVLISGEGYLDYLRRKVGISERDMRKTVLPIFFKAEVGEITEAEMRRQMAKKLGILEKDLLWPPRLKGVSVPNLELRKIAQELSSRYKIAMLSNMLGSRYRALVKNGIVIESMFRRRFVSYEVRMSKPHKSVYRLVLKEMHIKPEEAVMIDDMAKNVRGAESLGMRGIVFKDNARLLKELKVLGVRV